ncbi:MAG: hypothetical protein A3G93_00340 [Nitrospinae bacterium RIFCSPLOWO2_12_FULL_45_22]|nr:MAG: hypothetical protein A3G93_00340 [Nitrospinae bacterium RIFCSPLOWO2_12_FULL_45_22]
MLLEGENLYDFDRLFEREKTLGWQQETPLIMFNPPWLAVLVIPLALLKYEHAAYFWMIINLLVSFLSSALLWRVYAREKFPGYLGLVWAVTIIFYPTLLIIWLGQMTWLTLLGISGFLYFYKEERDYLCGIFLVLMTIKPNLMLILFPIILFLIIYQRRYKIFLSSGVLFLLLIAILTAYFPSWLQDYLGVALEKPPLDLKTPTIRYMAYKYLVGENIIQYFTLIFAPITILAFINWRKLIKLEEAMGTIIVMTFLSTIFCWSYDFVLFLIPIFEILSFSVLRSGLRGSKIGKMFLIFLFISNGILYWQGIKEIPNYVSVWFIPFFTVLFFVFRYKLMVTVQGAGLRQSGYYQTQDL